MRPRIFADWNSQTEDGRVWLQHPRSKTDVESTLDELVRGMDIILYWDPEDPDYLYEMDAVLDMHEQVEVWVARPIEGTERNIPKPKSGE